MFVCVYPCVCLCVCVCVCACVHACVFCQLCHLPLRRQEDIRKKSEESFARWKQEKTRQRRQAVQRQQEVEADKVKVAVICMALYRYRALYTLYMFLWARDGNCVHSA